MRWESVTATLGYSVYSLWNDSHKLLTLVFNPSSSAARIEYEGAKRVFLIRKEGFRKNKTVLRNEYGMHIGHMGSENNAEFIELDNERFFYDVDQHKDSPTVTIYKDFREQPLAVCDWEVKRKDAMGILPANKIDETTHHGLLMTLCWYLLQPIQRINRERSLEMMQA